MDCLSHLYPYPFLLKQNINLASNTILLTNLLEPAILIGWPCPDLVKDHWTIQLHRRLQNLGPKYKQKQ
jgi:hypothetical protein